MKEANKKQEEALRKNYVTAHNDLQNNVDLYDSELK